MSFKLKRQDLQTSSITFILFLPWKKKELDQIRSVQPTERAVPDRQGC